LATGMRFGLGVHNGNYTFMTHFNDMVSSVPACDGDWHHLAATYQGGSGTPVDQAIIYVDGTEIMRQTLTSLRLPANPPVHVGWNGDFLWYTGERWAGSLDDVRIYNYALT